MNVHIKPFECKICKKRFSESRYFNEHKLNHENPNPFECKKCSKRYTRLTSLTRHMHTAHSKSDERKFPCKQCKFRGRTKNDLTGHILNHTKPHKCDRCERKFSKPNMLHQHQALHDDPNAYQCKLCKKAFSSKNELKKHQKTNHVNEDDDE